MSLRQRRRNFLLRAGIRWQDLVCAEQVHAGGVKRVTGLDKGGFVFGADALITSEKGLPLAVFTADCLPVFLYDDKAGAIGLAHAGWRGSSKKITSRTIEKMRGEFNSRPEDLRAGFGPAIRSCCFEVGQEFKELFSGYLSVRNSAYYLDLAQANKEELLNSGVKEENIFDCRACTKCRGGQFFSYRREKEDSGRMISVIMLKKMI